MNLERHQRITIQDDKGREFMMTYRTPVSSNLIPGVKYDMRRQIITMHDQSTNATTETKVGDRVYWHECDMYHTKREGIVTKSVPLFWDYNAPIGHRAMFI